MLDPLVFALCSHVGPLAGWVIQLWVRKGTGKGKTEEKAGFSRLLGEKHGV